MARAMMRATEPLTTKRMANQAVTTVPAPYTIAHDSSATRNVRALLDSLKCEVHYVAHEC